MNTQKIKALEIIENGSIKVIMDSLWYVKSSETEDEYEVEKVEGGYTCGCQSWKFSEDKQCNHCIAVRIFGNGYISKDIISNIISLHNNDVEFDDIYDMMNM